MVLVFDVQSLLGTPQGKQVLCTELRPVLEDADIGMVGWGAVRFFPILNQGYDATTSKHKCVNRRVARSRSVLVQTRAACWWCVVCSAAWPCVACTSFLCRTDQTTVHRLRGFPEQVVSPRSATTISAHPRMNYMCTRVWTTPPLHPCSSRTFPRQTKRLDATAAVADTLTLPLIRLPSNTPFTRQEMHDAHDHVVALARLLQGLGIPPRINSVMDLQLAHEALWGDALNSFADALRAFRVCRSPSRWVEMRRDYPHSLVLYCSCEIFQIVLHALIPRYIPTRRRTVAVEAAAAAAAALRSFGTLHFSLARCFAYVLSSPPSSSLTYHCWNMLGFGGTGGERSLEACEALLVACWDVF